MRRTLLSVFCSLLLFAVAAHADSQGKKDANREKYDGTKSDIQASASPTLQQNRLDNNEQAAKSTQLNVRGCKKEEYKVLQSTGSTLKDAVQVIRSSSSAVPAPLPVNVGSTQIDNRGGRTEEYKVQQSSGSALKDAAQIIRSTPSAAPVVLPTENGNKDSNIGAGKEVAGRAVVASPKETETIERPVNNTVARYDRYLVKAKELFRTGRLNDAEVLVKKSLRVHPMNQPAIDFQKKIDRVKEKMGYARINIANEYYCSAEYLYKKGFVLDALLEIKRSLALDPDAKDARVLYDAISGENGKVLESINEKYRSGFAKAIQCFIDGNVNEAAQRLRKMTNDTAECEYYLPIVLAHISDENNRMRSGDYYDEALRQLNKGRYRKAQDNLYLALSMDKNNLDARLLLVQLDFEMAE